MLTASRLEFLAAPAKLHVTIVEVYSNNPTIVSNYYTVLPANELHDAAVLYYQLCRSMKRSSTKHGQRLVLLSLLNYTVGEPLKLRWKLWMGWVNDKLTNQRNWRYNRIRCARIWRAIRSWRLNSQLINLITTHRNKKRIKKLIKLKKGIGILISILIGSLDLEHWRKQNWTSLQSF